jgi:hypothetical protein
MISIGNGSAASTAKVVGELDKAGRWYRRTADVFRSIGMADRARESLCKLLGDFGEQQHVWQRTGGFSVLHQRVRPVSQQVLTPVESAVFTIYLSQILYRRLRG